MSLRVENSQISDYDDVRRALIEEEPLPEDTTGEIFTAQIEIEEEQTAFGAQQSTDEFLEDVQGESSEELRLRREWNIDRDRNVGEAEVENRNSGEVTGSIDIDFEVGFQNTEPLLGMKESLDEEYGDSWMAYRARGEAEAASEALQHFQDDAQLYLNYGDFNMGLSEENGDWTLRHFEFTPTTGIELDIEELKIPYKTIIEDVKDAADNNGVEYRDEVLSEAAKEHEDYVDWAVENNPEYSREDVLNPETESGGFFRKFL